MYAAVSHVVEAALLRTRVRGQQRKRAVLRDEGVEQRCLAACAQRADEVRGRDLTTHDHGDGAWENSHSIVLDPKVSTEMRTATTMGGPTSVFKPVLHHRHARDA
jgi:hypothetical protein